MSKTDGRECLEYIDTTREVTFYIMKGQEGGTSVFVPITDWELKDSRE